MTSTPSKTTRTPRTAALALLSLALLSLPQGGAAEECRSLGGFKNVGIGKLASICGSELQGGEACLVECCNVQARSYSNSWRKVFSINYNDNIKYLRERGCQIVLVSPGQQATYDDGKENTINVLNTNQRWNSTRCPLPFAVNWLGSYEQYCGGMRQGGRGCLQECCAEQRMFCGIGNTDILDKRNDCMFKRGCHECYERNHYCMTGPTGAAGRGAAPLGGGAVLLLLLVMMMATFSFA